MRFPFAFNGKPKGPSGSGHFRADFVAISGDAQLQGNLAAGSVAGLGHFSGPLLAGRPGGPGTLTGSRPLAARAHGPTSTSHLPKVNRPFDLLGSPFLY